MFHLYIYLQQRRGLRRERLIRDRLNPLQFYDDIEFRNLFRFSKQHVHELTRTLLLQIDHNTGRGSAISPIIQVCIGLRFFATGCFQISLGAWMNVDQSTVSRISWRVTKAVVNSFPDFFSVNIHADKEGFFMKHRIPNIIGALDCTHIRIQAPRQLHFPMEYINRKNFYSFNVQAVCNSNSVFTDVVAAWPGSVHDSRIFKNSEMYNKLSTGQIDGILLGDNGYSLTPFLLTPFLNPESDEQVFYNRVHKRARCTIERAFGQLKKRFSCLQRGLRCDLDRISSVIVACFILHNLAKQWSEPEFEDDHNDDHDNNDNDDHDNNDNDGHDNNDNDGQTVSANVNHSNVRVLRQLGQNKRMEVANYLFTNRT